MTEAYKTLYDQAENLLGRFIDSVDDGGASEMQSLRSELKEVVEDIASEKAPRSIEGRIQRVQQDLQHLKSAGQTMLSYGDVQTLYDGYEKLRGNLHRLPNY